MNIFEYDLHLFFREKKFFFKLFVHPSDIKNIIKQIILIIQYFQRLDDKRLLAVHEFIPVHHYSSIPGFSMDPPPVVSQKSCNGRETHTRRCSPTDLAGVTARHPVHTELWHP